MTKHVGVAWHTKNRSEIGARHSLLGVTAASYIQACDRKHNGILYSHVQLWYFQFAEPDTPSLQMPGINEYKQATTYKFPGAFWVFLFSYQGKRALVPEIYYLLNSILISLYSKEPIFNPIS